MRQRGSIVRLGPKWSKQEERHLLYGVREYYEVTGLTVEKDILPFDTEKIIYFDAQTKQFIFDKIKYRK